MKVKAGILFIFLGSVFLTSEKFVDTLESIKFYFTVLTVLTGIFFLFFQSSGIKSGIRKMFSVNVIKGLYLIGLIQAVYGILQYIEIYPSHHKAFAVTGSFENPAGFAAILSLLFPIGIYWCIRSKRWEQRIVFFSAGLIFFSMILTGSRTGLLAAVISLVLILCLEYQVFAKIRIGWYFYVTMTVAVLFLTIGVFFLYQWKQDSVNGRLLVWKVSAEMIKDKPILGFGHKGFQANYMDYQSRYFERNPQSKLGQLADNVKHPFNEFIKITVDYGIVGLLSILLLLIFIFLKLYNKVHLLKPVLLGSYISFIILCCFSYPLQYVSVWILLGYFILSLFCEQLPDKRLSPLIYFPIMAGYLWLFAFFFKRMNHEMEWKNIAVKSLQGQTRQMLRNYGELYQDMKWNEYFLYNYGAELHFAGQYRQSMAVFHECQKKYNDYDLQMLLADNHYHLGDTVKALQIYQYAGNMIPCRFLPLYHRMEIYKENRNTSKAMEMAQKIVQKPIKMRSATVNFIIEKAREYLNEQEIK